MRIISLRNEAIAANTNYFCKKKTTRSSRKLDLFVKEEATGTNYIT